MSKIIKHLSLLLYTIVLCFWFSYSQNSKTVISRWPNENWLVSTPEEQGVDSEILLKMFEFIRSSPKLDFHSVIIIRHSHIIAEAYWAPYNKNTTHNIKSASKSIISALVGVALEKNYLNNLEQKVSEFYSEYTNDSLKRNISLHDLLTMSAGLDWKEDAGPSAFDLNSWNKVSMKYKPGRTFEYNTALTHMMSAVLTKVCGESTKDFADKWLFKPLGINEYQWRKSKDGIYYGGSDLFLTPRDMAKFGFLFLNNGIWNAKQIVPKEWVKKSTTRQVNIPKDIDYAAGLEYGYWWWIQEKAYMAWGAGGQYIIVNPDLDLVVVFTADGFDNINLYDKFMKRFLENYIYSAAISITTIPAKPMFVKELNDIVEELEYPKEIPAKKKSIIAATISTTN
jgi:CubicO group peptidase (beta-lactamase class C family)